jgi:hypothetical protein
MDKPYSQPTKRGQPAPPKSKHPPELFQVVIECRDEAQQRELFERLRREGLRVRLLVL